MFCICIIYEIKMENKKKIFLSNWEFFVWNWEKNILFWHWEWGWILAPEWGDGEPCKVSIDFRINAHISFFRFFRKKLHFWQNSGTTHTLFVKQIDGFIMKVSVVRPSTISNIFSSETTGPIKLKFHMETPYDWWTKVCSNGHGHMSKMAATPICGKNPLKIFFSRTRRPMTLGLGV